MFKNVTNVCSVAVSNYLKSTVFCIDLCVKPEFGANGYNEKTGASLVIYKIIIPSFQTISCSENSYIYKKCKSILHCIVGVHIYMVIGLSLCTKNP